MLLSNIFEVSADFLLKDERTIQANEERGYYVKVKKWKGAFIRYSNLTIGILGFMYSPGVMETYELPVKNDEYSKDSSLN